MGRETVKPASPEHPCVLPASAEGSDSQLGRLAPPREHLAMSEDKFCLLRGGVMLPASSEEKPEMLHASYNAQGSAHSKELCQQLAKMSIVLTLRCPELATSSWATCVPLSSSKCCCPESIGIIKEKLCYIHKYNIDLPIYLLSEY